jgi:hypothetical protein
LFACIIKGSISKAVLGEGGTQPNVRARFVIS